jgi:hypothetical protein
MDCLTLTRTDISRRSQVDNPINVLSQDHAKAFLAHSGPKEKYDVSRCAPIVLLSGLIQFHHV